VELYLRISVLLSRIGEIEAGAQVIQQQLEATRRRSALAEHAFLEEGLVAYCIGAGPSLAPAYEAAERMLRAKPTNLDALLVKADRLRAAGRPGAGRLLARHLLESAPPETIPQAIDWLRKIEEGDPHRIERVDVLELVDPDADAVWGRWRREGSRIGCRPASHARLVLPVVPEGDYELSVVFWRQRGEDSVNLVLPVADRQVLLVVGGWPAEGTRSGLELIDGHDSRDNPSTDREFRITNVVRHVLEVVVTTEGDQAQIDVWVDAKHIISWSGSPSSLSLDKSWALPEGSALAMGAFNSTLRFEAARILMKSGSLRHLR
jgi:hypothetical protein